MWMGAVRRELKAGGSDSSATNQLVKRLKEAQRNLEDGRRVLRVRKRERATMEKKVKVASERVEKERKGLTRAEHELDEAGRKEAEAARAVLRLEDARDDMIERVADWKALVQDRRSERRFEKDEKTLQAAIRNLDKQVHQYWSPKGNGGKGVIEHLNRKKAGEFQPAKNIVAAEKRLKAARDKLSALQSIRQEKLGASAARRAHAQRVAEEKLQWNREFAAFKKTPDEEWAHAQRAAAERGDLTDSQRKALLQYGVLQPKEPPNA